MDYNTQRPRLVLPEYGRLVQNMVDYAVGLTDRAQRQALAETIVNVMAGFFPAGRSQPDFRHKLWDHLALMSGYRLDVDYPYPVTPKQADTAPKRLPYPQSRIKFRHYGLLIEELTRKLKEMPEGEERRQLALLVAGQMKRSLSEWNKDALNDRKIVDDLARYTDGAVVLEPEDIQPARGAVPQASRAAGRMNKRYKRNF